MDTFIVWVMVGAIIGVFADLLDFYSTASTMLSSVVLGIVGAITGGVLSQFLVYNPVSFLSISPLLYIIMGAIMLVILPKQNKILP